MKKFLAILLALTCAFAMFACNEEEPPCTVHIDENGDAACDICSAAITPKDETVDAGTNYRNAAAAFINALDTTVVSNINVEVTVVIDGEPISSFYTTVYNEDGTADMSYSIAKIPGIDSDMDVDYEEGTVRFDESNPVDGNIGATGVKLNLKSDKIKNYTVQGNVLTISLSASDATAVVGYAVNADATLVVTRAADQIVSITLTYGETTIICSYNVA